MSSTTRCHQHRGFSLAGLSVVIVVLAVLAAILLPALAAGQKKSSKIGCVNNLKQCELAFRVWEGDNGDKYPMDVSMTNGGTMEFITGADTFRHFQVMLNAGNVGLSDGNVQSYSNAGLRQALKNSGSPTNTWRIALSE